jgi:uncharacterized protein with HEPN domain
MIFHILWILSIAFLILLNIIGLRNKLAHDYGEILAARIWQIAKKSIPELIIELEKIEDLKEYIAKKKDHKS